MGLWFFLIMLALVGFGCGAVLVTRDQYRKDVEENERLDAEIKESLTTLAKKKSSS